MCGFVVWAAYRPCRTRYRTSKDQGCPHTYPSAVLAHQISRHSSLRQSRPCNNQSSICALQHHGGHRQSLPAIAAKRPVDPPQPLVPVAPGLRPPLRLTRYPSHSQRPTPGGPARLKCPACQRKVDSLHFRHGQPYIITSRSSGPRILCYRYTAAIESCSSLVRLYLLPDFDILQALGSRCRLALSLDTRLAARAYVTWNGIAFP